MSRPDANRVQLSVRLDVEDKKLLASKCEADGIEASVAARQILELLCQRLRAGEGYIELLARLKAALHSGVATARR